MLLLFAAAYRLGAGPESLLATQAGMVGAAALPLFYATRRLTGSPVAALGLALAFLLNPSLHRAIDFDLHPELLGFPFVFGASYFLAARRPVISVLAIAPILLLKEDMAVVAAVFGALVWARGGRREGAALFGLSMLWGLAAFFIVMPMLRGGAGDLNGRFHYLTEDTTLATVLPVVAWRGLSQLAGETVPAAASLLAETGGLALLHPAVALAVPSAALNGLADHPQQSRLDLQYVMAPLAMAFVSAALALGDIAHGREIVRRMLPRRAASAAPPVLAAIALAAATAAFLASSPFSPGAARYAPGGAHREIVASALKLIPGDANVSAQNTLVPHLSQRREIFEFPDVREGTEYVIVDATLPITGQSRDAGYDGVLAKLGDWGFREIFDRDGVRVFARDIDR